MDNQENGISLGQLFSVVKKSLLRGLIYVLVSVIMLTAILVLVKTFTSTNVYNATVTFSTADANALSSMNSYKANAVNKALKTDDKSLDVSDEVVKNLSVSAIIPAANEDDSSFIPTSFTVSLKSSSELNFSSGEYKSLVDNIAKEYVNQFATGSMPELYLSVADVNSQLEHNAEYLQIAFYLSDIIDDYLLNLNSFASSNTAAATFANNGTTLNSVISDLNFLKSSVDSLKYTIAINKYGFKLNEYLATAEALITAEEDKYQQINTDAQAALTAYKATISDITQTENNVYVVDTSVFKSLSEKAEIASKQFAEATRKKTEITTLKTLVGSESGTQNEGVATSLKAYATTLSSVLTNYKKLSNEFNDNKILISAATVSKPAYSKAESFIGLKIILIADVAFALIAYVVAFSQTFAIMKKKGELN